MTVYVSSKEVEGGTVLKTQSFDSDLSSVHVVYVSGRVLQKGIGTPRLIFTHGRGILFSGVFVSSVRGEFSTTVVISRGLGSTQQTIKTLW